MAVFLFKYKLKSPLIYTIIKKYIGRYFYRWRIKGTQNEKLYKNCKSNVFW